MQCFDDAAMRSLSFPDINVEKMQFSSTGKNLAIFISGGWLDTNGGQQLGRGVLHFKNWEKLTISRYYSDTEKWAQLDESTIEPLKDICEMNFSDSSICLYGFGKQIGLWMEWKIQKPKMYAEFE
jgi:hypothetical protein